MSPHGLPLRPRPYLRPALDSVVNPPRPSTLGGAVAELKAAVAALRVAIAGAVLPADLRGWFRGGVYQAWGSALDARLEGIPAGQRLGTVPRASRPVASPGDQAEQIVAWARRHGVPVVIGHPERPLVEEVVTTWQGPDPYPPGVNPDFEAQRIIAWAQVPEAGRDRHCPVSLARCGRRECGDGCAYVLDRPWPPPAEG